MCHVLQLFVEDIIMHYESYSNFYNVLCMCYAGIRLQI